MEVPHDGLGAAQPVPSAISSTWTVRVRLSGFSFESRRRRNLSTITEQCEEGDLNPYSFRNQILSLARLPVPPSSPMKSGTQAILSRSILGGDKVGTVPSSPARVSLVQGVCNQVDAHPGDRVLRGVVSAPASVSIRLSWPAVPTAAGLCRASSADTRASRPARSAPVTVG